MNTDESPGSARSNSENTEDRQDSEQIESVSAEKCFAQNSEVQRIVMFSDIAGDTTEVIIEHEGQKYRLRATRNGRLLLNK